MSATYILTTFSPTMFGEKASIYMRQVSKDEAKSKISDETRIIATRESHENMARNLFGDRDTARYADMGPDKSAILIHYRGPPVGDDGHTPKGGTLTFYLIETEPYEEPE